MPTKTGGRVFAYARASTSMQAVSTTDQLEAIREYAIHAKNSGILSIDETVVDEDTSASDLDLRDRPNGGRMLAKLRRGDQVIVTRMDRLFRRLSHAVPVLDTFSKRQVGLHIIQLNGLVLDASSPIGKMLLGLLVLIAEMERDTLSERTMAAVKLQTDRAIREGKRLPNSGAICRLGFKHEPVLDSFGRPVMIYPRGTDMTKQPLPEPKPKLVMIPDWEDRRLMALVVELVDGPPRHEYKTVARILNRDLRVFKPANRTKDPNRKHEKHGEVQWIWNDVEKWYKAEKYLRKLEREGAEEMEREEAGS